MISRRRFLQSAAAAAPLILTSPAFARGKPGPNDQVAIGLIGLGGRCTDIMKTAVEIPQAGTKHSLNVSVAIGIVLWELVRRAA